MSEAPADVSRTRAVVTRQQVGERLDRALAALLPISRRAARVAITDGRVRRNSSIVRQQGRRVELGDVLELSTPAGLEPSVASAGALARPLAQSQDPSVDLPLDQRLSVLLRDPYLLAIDKPAGMLSQASARSPFEAAADQIVLEALALELGRRPFVRLIHRLDRDTSGVLLFAIDPRATAPLARAWASEAVERRYLARVAGTVEADHQRVELPIAKIEGEWRFATDPAGQAAITEIEVIERSASETLVACRLLTGRTHQVRVHLAAIGHPVLGDWLYGGSPAARVALHAESLVLPHPADGRPVEIRAPVPALLVGL